VIDYIQKGGLLMWPILGCSIISIAIFAERLFYLHRATIHVGEFLKGLSNLIRRRNFAEALHESAGTPGPVARVIHSAIIRHDAPRSELRDISAGYHRVSHAASRTARYRDRNDRRFWYHRVERGLRDSN
jgi:biopolymer transport protein ExbB